MDFSTLLGERGVGVGRGIEEEVKEMGDDDDEWREAVQEAEGPRSTDASMREVQGLVDGDVHMVDEEREEHYGMDVDGPAPAKISHLTKMKMKRRRCTDLWSSLSSTVLYRQGRKYPPIYHHQTLHPRLLHLLQGSV